MLNYNINFLDNFFKPTLLHIINPRSINNFPGNNLVKKQEANLLKI